MKARVAATFFSSSGLVSEIIEVLDYGHIHRLCNLLGCAELEGRITILDPTPLLKLTDLLCCDFALVGKVGI